MRRRIYWGLRLIARADKVESRGDWTSTLVACANWLLMYVLIVNADKIESLFATWF